MTADHPLTPPRAWTAEELRRDQSWSQRLSEEEVAGFEAGLAHAKGVAKDWLSHLVAQGTLGPGLRLPFVPYSVVYHVEVLFLFATLVALGPLVARRAAGTTRAPEGAASFGLADVPA